MCAWGFAFPKLFILSEHRSHLEEFRQAGVPRCLCSALMRARAPEAAASPAPRGPASFWGCLGLTASSGPGQGAKGTLTPLVVGADGFPRARPGS